MSRDVIASGQMIHGIKQNDIFPLLPAQLITLTTGDISMFQMVKEMINDKSVTDSYSAQTQQSNTTATQIINEQKQTMLKLGSSIDGIKSLAFPRKRKCKSHKGFYLCRIIASYPKRRSSKRCDEVLNQ